MTKGVLVAARELISDPERWTQGALARDVEGAPTVTSYKVAARWCLTGAVSRCAPYGSGVYARAIEVLRRNLGDVSGDSLMGFNDYPGRKHADVLAVLDRAIERCDE